MRSPGTGSQISRGRPTEAMLLLAPVPIQRWIRTTRAKFVGGVIALTSRGSAVTLAALDHIVAANVDLAALTCIASLRHQHAARSNRYRRLFVDNRLRGRPIWIGPQLAIVAHLISPLNTIEHPARESLERIDIPRCVY